MTPLCFVGVLLPASLGDDAAFGDPGTAAADDEDEDDDEDDDDEDNDNDDDDDFGDGSDGEAGGCGFAHAQTGQRAGVCALAVQCSRPK